MSKIDELKADQLEARKSGDKIKASLLTTLIGEVSKVPPAKKLPDGSYETVVHVISDDKVFSSIDAMLKNNQATLDALENEFQRVMGHSSNDGKTRPLTAEGREFMDGIVPRMRNVEREIEILRGYKPQGLSREELASVISEFKGQNPEAKIGDVMAHLKANFTGRYDGKLASELARA